MGMAGDESEDDYVASESDGNSSISRRDGPPKASASRNRTTHHHHPKSDQKPAKGYLSKDYRDLLNIEIEDVNRRSQNAQLGPSQIGASKWTSREKEALFQCLASRGPDDLPALRRAVRTKSEQEVRIYILLLQDAVTAQEDTGIKTQKQGPFMHSDIPAAAEISSEGERALDLAADALAAHVEKHISQQEQEKFGDDWLVDEDVAERMDLLLEQSQPETDLDANDSAEYKDGSSGTQRFSSLEAGISTLLCPSSLLRLSRSIFMNNGEDDDLNWHHVDSISTGSTEPALFQTALEDLHNIALSITRRAVQATIFQATSRLRAEDASRKDWTPLGAIREVDVRTAVDLLGLPRDSNQYWATVARRCKVGVCSESKKYADGRPSTRSGHTLTYDEVEAELGLHGTKESAWSHDAEAHILDEEEIDELMEDSDLFTEEHSSESTAELPQELGGEVPTKTSNKRRRALSPTSFFRAEVSQLEALDKTSSVQEEKRLWELLRLDPPEQITANRKKPADMPTSKLPVSIAANWRSHVDYEAEWEQSSGIPATKRFKVMESAGNAGSMNRAYSMKMMRKRLETSDSHDDSKHNASDDEPNSRDDDAERRQKKPVASSVYSSTDKSG